MLLAVAQMVGQLAAQRPLHRRFLQLRNSLHRPAGFDSPDSSSSSSSGLISRVLSVSLPLKNGTRTSAYTMSHFIVFSKADGHDYGRLMQHMLNERGQQTDALMERVGELRQQFCDELQVFFPNMSNQLLFRSVEALGAVMLSESLNHAEEILRAAHPDRERMNEERSMFCAQLISGGLCQLSKRYTQR